MKNTASIVAERSTFDLLTDLSFIPSFFLSSDPRLRDMNGGRIHESIIDKVSVHQSDYYCPELRCRFKGLQPDQMKVTRCMFGSKSQNRCTTMMRKECNKHSCPVILNRLTTGDSFCSLDEYYCDNHLPTNCVKVMSHEAMPYHGCICDVQGNEYIRCSFAQCPSFIHPACMADSSSTKVDDPDCVEGMNGQLFCVLHLPRSSLLVTRDKYLTITDHNETERQRRSLLSGRKMIAIKSICVDSIRPAAAAAIVAHRGVSLMIGIAHCTENYCSASSSDVASNRDRRRIEAFIASTGDHVVTYDVRRSAADCEANHFQGDYSSMSVSKFITHWSTVVVPSMKPCVLNSSGIANSRFIDTIYLDSNESTVAISIIRDMLVPMAIHKLINERTRIVMPYHDSINTANLNNRDPNVQFRVEEIGAADNQLCIITENIRSSNAGLFEGSSLACSASRFIVVTIVVDTTMSTVATSGHAQFIAGSLDPLIGLYNQSRYTHLLPEWFRIATAAYMSQGQLASGLSFTRRVSIPQSLLYIFVSHLSEVGHPLQFGIKCARDIMKGEVITNYGGVLRDAGEMRSNASIVKSHTIELMGGDGLVLDGFPLRRAMVSAIPRSASELSEYKRMPASTWGYDRAVIESQPPELRSLWRWGTGFLLNAPEKNQRANAKFESIRLNTGSGLQNKLKIVRAITDIKSGTEIMCEYNTSVGEQSS